VANGFDSEYFKKIGIFEKKIDNSNLINTFMIKMIKKIKGPEWRRRSICVVPHVCGLHEAFYTFS